MAVCDLFKPLAFKRGPSLKNRMILAPLTNWQSNVDGTVSKEDEHWLQQCVKGGFSMIMTAAANVHADGKTFPGQLGIYHDRHLEGLKRVADMIRENGATSSVQLHHGGARAQKSLGSDPVGPSAVPEMGVRALSLEDVETLRDDYVRAAKRAEMAGFDGVEVHAAFGWVLSQFLSPTYNYRTDRYGGSLENRARLLFEVIDRIRATCRPDFQIGLRLSMERHGLHLKDIRDVAARAMKEEQIDYLDLAPWDFRKLAQDDPYQGQTLLSVFTDLPRSSVRLGVSGKILGAQDAADALAAGCDFVMIGKAAILQSDFPQRVEMDHQYHAPALPVTRDYLKEQGLSANFIAYMETWDGFVQIT
ncbi:NADH:flavin oxidoreductase/NADH oxidase, partial [Aureobasidium melanogenum]|uniref:NADH:flavin oxidoreductase/NADH oxidase n=1 Tax=Aureobasidium melanogenum (strain CBS 110374) TaxID=1043003 RepID=A0A074VL56_AURM1